MWKAPDIRWSTEIVLASRIVCNLSLVRNSGIKEVPKHIYNNTVRNVIKENKSDCQRTKKSTMMLEAGRVVVTLLLDLEVFKRVLARGVLHYLLSWLLYGECVTGNESGGCQP